MHKQKSTSMKRSKCARYIESVILLDESNNYELVLTSFWSTSSSSYNIMSINSMSENIIFVEARSRGCKEHKCVSIIKQNMVITLHFKSYCQIDSIDHLIKTTTQDTTHGDIDMLPRPMPKYFLSL